MKKLLLSFSLMAGLIASAQTSSVYSYGFDGTTADLDAAGWTRVNQSTPNTTTLWTVASYTPTLVTNQVGPLPFTDIITPVGQTSNPPSGQAGGVNSFALVNFTSTTGIGTISNWMITPTITVQNGDVVSFYTRIGQNAATTAAFADNMQFRMSTAGAESVAPTTGSADVGSFTNLLVDINPTQNNTDYPTSWTMISTTISGLTGPTAVKFAFRYFVVEGGPSGNFSNIIGVDSFEVNRTLSSSEFFANNFALYPNPASDVLNITSKSNTAINQITITDLNGRTVKEVKNMSATNTIVNVADLSSGLYIINVTSNEGSGAVKFAKN